MSQMFVMRRANGDLFTEEIDGKRIIPVWTNEEALARYKERNPELMTFIATRLTRSLIARIGNAPGPEVADEFFLLAEDDPDANLDDGRPISIEEILTGYGRTPQPAQPQL